MQYTCSRKIVVPPLFLIPSKITCRQGVRLAILATAGLLLQPCMMYEDFCFYYKIGLYGIGYNRLVLRSRVETL